ncbi:MAG: ketol-acid reductoisomerase [Acidobacteria bacterium]|nr:ketol-acid reductoisomerase [Acidobacteriota bacterium]
MKVLTAKDASLDVLKGVKIAVIGYGAQGRAQARCFKDSGLDVVVGVRAGGPSEELARQDGLDTSPIPDAVAKADLIHILIPDETQHDVYAKDIAPHLKTGKTLSFSHGFSIVYKRIVPPAGVDVILVAPKSPGTEERKAFLEGFGVPGLIAVRQDTTGKAREKALALAHAVGLTRAGVLECSFEDETYEDLFGEQAVLCGGAAELVKAGFETLTEAGYPPEMAYFECLHELKLIVDLMYQGGLTHMWHVVSNTAEFGGRTIGPRIIGPEVRRAMKDILANVHDGSFARTWVAEYEAGIPTLTRMREEEAKHPIEVVGRQVRALFTKDGA